MVDTELSRLIGVRIDFGVGARDGRVVYVRRLTNHLWVTENSRALIALKSVLGVTKNVVEISTSGQLNATTRNLNTVYKSINLRG